MRSLQTEGLVFLTVVCAFFAVTLPYYFGHDVTVSAVECSWWKLLGCTDAVFQPNYLLLSAIVIVGCLALAVALRKEAII
jgi:hypothetical protein